MTLGKLSGSCSQVTEAGPLHHCTARETGQVKHCEEIFVPGFTFYAICSKCCEMCLWKEWSVHELGLPWAVKMTRLK